MIQLIILLGIISIIDFSTKKIPVVVLVVMASFSTLIPICQNRGLSALAPAMPMIFPSEIAAYSSSYYCA